MVIPVSATFCAIIALLFVYLSFRVSTFRLRYRKGLGFTDSPGFEAAVRAQANLAEYAPLALLMLALGELNGVPVQAVYWLGMSLVAGRFLHAWGMIAGEGRPHKARFTGILLTWLMMLVTAALLLWNVYFTRL